MKHELDMNTSEISLDEQAEAFKAWKRGEEVEWWAMTRWEKLHGSGLLTFPTVIRRKPAPKLRPWSGIEEVPIGAKVKAAGSARDWIGSITGASGAGVYITAATTWLVPFENSGNYLWETPTGWKPCGVEEAS